MSTAIWTLLAFAIGLNAGLALAQRTIREYRRRWKEALTLVDAVDDRNHRPRTPTARDRNIAEAVLRSRAALARSAAVKAQDDHFGEVDRDTE